MPHQSAVDATRYFRAPLFALTLSCLSLLLVLNDAQAELRCDCTQVIDSCSASVGLDDMQVSIESDNTACSRVDYLIDGQPFSALVVGGKTSLNWSGQPLRDAQIVVENCRVCADSSNTAATPTVTATEENSEEADTGSPRSIVKVMPNYPRDAWTNQIEGDVVAEFSVTEQGKVQNIRILNSSNPLFVTETMDAVSRFRYSPALENGQPVTSTGIRERFKFRLLGGNDPAVTSETP
jgi:TonB family protein